MEYILKKRRFRKKTKHWRETKKEKVFNSGRHVNEPRFDEVIL
jgi:hypothetical protein